MAAAPGASSATQTNDVGAHDGYENNSKPQTSLALRFAYAEAEGANRRVKELEGELEALNDAHRPPK